MQFDTTFKKSHHSTPVTGKNVGNISGIFSKPNMQIYCHWDAAEYPLYYCTNRELSNFKYVGL